ncbi:hypothetical protein DQ04_01671090 [Trypanosoma grayi]|uniref:hypothetical protein n=1 Tax=Trypanosoma grayi TaxID=71804 RepID=UPI0004F411A2|nr:hypothetical protein DQ04_01671090 [Trypanosoma grayi]KEG12492.1 hypothetical protein DQ04_01671090 [Trypanosoma grayi]
MNEYEDASSDASCSGEVRSLSSAEDAELTWIPGEDEHVDKESNGGEFDEDEAPPYMASDFSSALANDLANQQQQKLREQDALKEGSPVAQASGASIPRICCICGDAALYTCPGCGARTCSITCVRMHKTESKCTGERDMAKKVPLSEFTDRHLQRDFYFLEDVRRVVSNCERTFPKMWRYTFRALPPPLYALREAAKKRGVVCQITSEGMTKRDANTSRYDRKTETITWRCQFNFHDPDFCVATDWGSERHRLGDIVAYCWATKPSLPCFHINRQYNRASKWIGTSEKDESAVTPAGKGYEAEKEDEEAMVVAEEDQLHPSQPLEQQQQQQQHLDEESRPDECEMEVTAEDDAAPAALFVDSNQHQQEMWRPSKLVIAPLSPVEKDNEKAVSSFLAAGPVIILAQAERLGLQQKYFLMSPSATLNEALRTLFFINEFPVFEIIHAADLDAYPLVTEADKESIRESFRMAPRPPKPERKPRRTKADLTPDEVERCARVPCRMFLAGCCRLSEEDCPYWHCEYKDVPACRSFSKFAACEKGDRCSFRHDAAAVSAARKRAREERQQPYTNRNRRRHT